jgi:hypothetical protein
MVLTGLNWPKIEANDGLHESRSEASGFINKGAYLHQPSD